MRSFSAILLATAFGLVAPLAAHAQDKVKVLASFSIIADMAKRVGGDRVEVKSLVGPNGDAHVYEPTPQDAKAVSEAGVVLVNGLGFEGWLDRLVEASGYKGQVAVLSEGVEALKAEEGHDHGHEEHADGDKDHDHDHEEHASEDKDHGHDHGAFDPHAWQNAENAARYAENIARALCNTDSMGCESYKANAFAYIGELKSLHGEIKAAMERIPADRRTVIMSHDAFGYFASAYGLTFLAPEGVSTESEASAKDVAKLIEQIREHKASALFVENVSDPRLIEQIARETGLTIGGELYSDALSDASGPAPTYIDMMRHNMKTLTQAITGS